MTKLIVRLENCYGIKRFDYEFDFSQTRVAAIYAPNGSMKSSFAKTFKDLAEGRESRDLIFPSRITVRKITDEAGASLSKDSVLVVPPYDEVFGQTEKTSTLLVDNNLRQEYENLHVEIEKAKQDFLVALKGLTGSKKDIEKEISSTFTSADDEFYTALCRVLEEVKSQSDAPFASINYDTVFDDKVISLLNTKDVKSAIKNYITRLNELLDASTYFKRGTFNYKNGGAIAKSLADNGFFKAKHTVHLNAGEVLEITTQKQLEDLIASEMNNISTDPSLRKTYDALAKSLDKNASVRAFEAYLAGHEDILPRLENIERFKEDVWKSFFKTQESLYVDVVAKYRAAEKRKKEIEEIASAQRTQWETVIDLFNRRFIVPFKLTAKNRVSVILGKEPMLTLGFTFEDGLDSANVGKDDLMRVLSTGEKKALYILNIMFEVEARNKAQQPTVFVVDDIADSFDYKNKYAIIQYLNEITEKPWFHQILLTHNFDFFRTVNSRFVPYRQCFMIRKDSAGIELCQAAGIKNIFVNDWKERFYDDNKKKIACIPFMRNIIEYTKGDQDSSFVELTSLLHWKAASREITISKLDTIYNGLFGTNRHSGNAVKPVIDLILEEASGCVTAAQAMNFENKVVLSIAVRLVAEEFMINKINDPAFVGSILANQTAKLTVKFRELFSGDARALEVLQRVALMTPENIHLNSFMYEPILDMSDEHLRTLYSDVRSLA